MTTGIERGRLTISRSRRYGSRVIDDYLTVLGTPLIGVALLVVIFVIAMAQDPVHGHPTSTVIGVASALLAPALVAAVTVVVRAVMGFTIWRVRVIRLRAWFCLSSSVVLSSERFPPLEGGRPR
jgi:hypothetical protein